MIDRETLAAQLYVHCSYLSGDRVLTVDPNDAFFVADKFLKEAAKQREPKACEHWGSSATEPCDYCKSCGAPKVKPETQKPEPNCEHKWVSDGGECYYCQKCNEPKAKKPEPPKPVDPSKCPDGWHKAVCPTCKSDNEAANPEPPKPERKAREVWVCFNSAGIPMYAWNEQDRDKTRMLFREILPGDEK